MKEQIVIDENGYVVDNSVLVDDKGNYQDFEMKDNYISLDIPYNLFDFIKPRWNGSQWVETASEEEKEKLFPKQEQQPSKEEILEQQLLQTQAALAELQANILLQSQGGTV